MRELYSTSSYAPMDVIRQIYGVHYSELRPAFYNPFKIQGTVSFWQIELCLQNK